MPKRLPEASTGPAAVSKNASVSPGLATVPKKAVPTGPAVVHTSTPKPVTKAVDKSLPSQPPFPFVTAVPSSPDVPVPKAAPDWAMRFHQSLQSRCPPSPATTPHKAKGGGQSSLSERDLSRHDRAAASWNPRPTTAGSSRDVFVQEGHWNPDLDGPMPDRPAQTFYVMGENRLGWWVDRSWTSTRRGTGGAESIHSSRAGGATAAIGGATKAIAIGGPKVQRPDRAKVASLRKA